MSSETNLIAELASALKPKNDFKAQYPESPNLYEQRLAGLKPAQRLAALLILNKAMEQGYDFRLRETLRTKKQQADKVARGVSERSSLNTSKHLTGEAFDLVRFKDGKPVWDKDSYMVLSEIIDALNLPVQQGYITNNIWKDWGHIQAPSDKGMYGGVKNWEDIIKSSGGY